MNSRADALEDAIEEVRSLELQRDWAGVVPSPRKGAPVYHPSFYFKLDSFGKELAARIRDRREYLGMSRFDVAEAIGLSESGYGHLEVGRSAFKMRHLAKLVKILDVPMSYFLPAAGEADEEDGTRYTNRYLVIDREDSQTVRLSPEEEDLLARLLDMIRRGRK